MLTDIEFKRYVVPDMAKHNYAELTFRGAIRTKHKNNPFSKYGMERPPIILSIIDLKRLRWLPLWALRGFPDNDCLIFCQHHNSRELREDKKLLITNKPKLRENKLSLSHGFMNQFITMERDEGSFHTKMNWCNMTGYLYFAIFK